MKRLLLFVCLLYILSGCNSPAGGSPKETLSKFLTAMQNNNYEEAKKYATSDSQSFLDMLDKKGEASNNIYNDKTFKITNVDVKGSTANVETVFSPGVTISFRLRSEHGEWKVYFSWDALIDRAKDIFKEDGIDIDKDINDAIDSIKTNPDSLP